MNFKVAVSYRLSNSIVHVIAFFGGFIKISSSSMNRAMPVMRRRRVHKRYTWVLFIEIHTRHTTQRLFFLNYVTDSSFE